jgi:uncharacterized damage-inducible protein DinB
MEPTVVELFRHNLWANLRLLDACALLTPAQLEATAAGTYGSIYDTLLHIIASEEWYLSGLTGHLAVDAFGQDDRPALAELRDHALRAAEALTAASAGVAPKDVARWQSSAGERSMPAARLLAQVINHATEHRAQVNVILTQLGVSPVDSSGWAYNRSQTS